MTNAASMGIDWFMTSKTSERTDWSECSDKGVLKAMKKGDDSALRNSQKIRRISERIVSSSTDDRDLAQDVAQGTFLKLLKASYLLEFRLDQILAF
jgi:hypothetical protein